MKSFENVKVIPKSEKYNRADLEAALGQAYEETGLILDFMKETDKYIILYLKEKDV